MEMKPDNIVGVWTLVETYIVDDGGNKIPTLGENPKGRIIYTPDGYMVAMTEIDDRKPLSDNASDSEKAAAFDNFMTYSGKWTLKDNIVRSVKNTNPKIKSRYSKSLGGFTGGK